ncbi:hypothetical protein ACP70R_029379 [Stipagrostis hirtigluma subsp. patula]
MSVSVEEDTFSRWSCDFVLAHAIFGTGLITVPVAGVHLVKHPHSATALFFAMFAVFFATISLILCCRFYSELKRPPWPRWLSAASASGGEHGQQQDGGRESALRTAAREMSHGLRRHPEQPVMDGGKVQAALAAGRVPSYEHPDGAAVDCAVCLGEVEKGETVRRLPVCQHVFHKECIDLWLRAHATCPICRSGVLPARRERLPEVVVEIGDGHGQPSPRITVQPSITSSV